MQRDSDLVEILRREERAWNERPCVRRLYEEWYEMILRRLSDVPGRSVEIGSGIGRLGAFSGGRVLLTDVEPTPWASETVDATALPFGDQSLANIVALDVFHHIADPGKFLQEAERALVTGGRVVMIEPYCSPVSYRLYRRFHRERTDMSVDPFVLDAEVAQRPFASNQATPTLYFFRYRDRLESKWPELTLTEAETFSLIVYPLSGGFTGRNMLPAPLYGPLRALERLLRPMRRLLAFRCLVVLEKR